MGNIRGGTLGFHGTMGQPTAQVIDGSLKFDDGSSQYLGRTPGSVGNRRTWTASFWTKSNPSGSTKQTFIQCRVSSNSDDTGIGLENDKIRVVTGVVDAYITSRLLRDPCAWYHIVVVFDTTQSTDSERVKVYVNNELDTGGTTSYPSQNTEWSINTTNLHAIGRHAGVATQYIDGYISQFYLIDGQALGPGYFGFTDPLTNTWRPKKFRAEGTTVNDGTVWSSGIPGNVLSGYPATQGFDGNISNYVYANNSSTMTWTAPKRITGQLIEVYVYAGNTHPIVLVNGKSTGAVVSGAAQQGVWVDVTDLCGGPGGVLETISAFGQNIGGVDRSSGWSAVRVDGVILTDSTTTNLDFGTNGFYLPMDNQDNFEKDKSGKGNDWTKNNFSGTSINPDVLKDSPSSAVFGGRAQTGITTTSSAPANYCILNPIDAFVSTKDGNLETATSSGWQGIRATLGMKSGKFYWETQNNQTAAAILGIADTQATGFVDGAIFGSTGHGGGDANPAWTWAGANYYFNATSAAAGSLANHTSSDIVQYAFDADSGNLWFGRNGTWYSSSWATTGDPANGVNPTVSGIDTAKTYVACGTFYNGSAKFNFGQKPFKYAPPQGYSPLNFASARPNKVIPRSDQYVGTTTWSGDNVDGREIDMGMSPDLIWVKTRNQTNWHWLTDTVRGAPNKLYSNSTNAEDTTPIYGQADSFTDKGWIAGGGTDSSNPLSDSNQTGTNYVCWGWKAGGNKNTFNVDDVGYATFAASGTTAGTITPTGTSIGTKQGFSIIKYAGTDTGSSQTIPHGLNEPPVFWMFKNLSQAADWIVYTTIIDGGSDYLKLNAQDAANSGVSPWSTAPTNSVITVGTNNVDTCNDGDNYVMYAWHNIPGLQKFGSFTGNNSTNGAFVELGFRAKLIIYKVSQSGHNWMIFDSERDKDNPCSASLRGNLNNAESSFSALDITSTGFKFRNTDTNPNNAQIIYMAWAEAPASNLFGGQSNAR